MSAVSLDAKWTDYDLRQVDECEQVCRRVGVAFSQSLLLINMTTQRLYLYERYQMRASYPISTAKNGIGQVEDSGQTPLGLHHICEKIGEGAPPFAVFKSRERTGEIAIRDQAESLIVGRILRLQGLDPGFNEGGNVDTFRRYIYIHGTNYVKDLGQPLSAGCVRMAPEDIIRLFERVSEMTLVYLYS